jgi:hypothetical protein
MGAKTREMASRAMSISSNVVYLENEKRRLALVGSWYPSALRTCEPVVAPLEQALPPEQDMPSRSSRNSAIPLFGWGGNLTLNTV